MASRTYLQLGHTLAQLLDEHLVVHHLVAVRLVGHAGNTLGEATCGDAFVFVGGVRRDGRDHARQTVAAQTTGDVS